MTLDYDLIYPDILGAITDSRIHLQGLQYAVGVSPRQAMLNQAVEVVIVLQSTLRQNMRVRVAVRTPTEDKQGNTVQIDAAKTMFSLGLRPGEVGILRMPIVPRDPTPPAPAYPLQVAVRYRTPTEDYDVVRPPNGGVIPSMLNISPIKLNNLQSIYYEAFPWYQSPEIVSSHFEVVQKAQPPLQSVLEPTYETLWSDIDMKDEKRFVSKSGDLIHKFVEQIPTINLYRVFLPEVEAIFGEHGMPLHMGEAQLVTRVLCRQLYADAACILNQQPIASRWYHLLKQLLAHYPELADNSVAEVLSSRLITAVIYDTIITAFDLLADSVLDRTRYADEIVMWLLGRGVTSLHYLYNPLIMGSLLINHETIPYTPTPAKALQLLKKAVEQRERLAKREHTEIFQQLRPFIAHAEQNLNASQH